MSTATNEPRDDSARVRAGYLVQLLKLLWTLSPGALAAIAVVEAARGLMPLLGVWALQHLVDVVSGAEPGGSARALAWAALLAGTGVLGAIVFIGTRLVTDALQERLKSRMQDLVVAKAQSLPLAAFEQPEVFDQMQRIEKSVDTQLFNTISSLFHIVGSLVTLLSLAAYTAVAHWALPLLLVIGSFLSLQLRVRRLREEYLLEREQTESERRLGYYASLMTGREAAAEVRLCGQQQYLLGSWQDLYHSLRNRRLALARRTFGLDGGSAIGQAVTLGLALMVVIAAVARHAVSLGELAAILGAVRQFQDRCFAIMWDSSIAANHLRFVGDFFAFMNLPSETTSGGPVQTVPQPQPGIVFEQVEFTYPGADRPVLRGLDLQILPGEKLALVGANGAGKTTLAKLLLGLYRPTAGRILVDGVDLLSVPPKAWRARATAVFQDFMHYHLTARENVALGNLDRLGDDAAVRRAAGLSGAAAVIEALPQGYDTLLGKEFDEGQELSEGQWQKIAVARAYMRDADVLVLDEPTAALDARAEVEVYRQFRDAAQGRTALLISHRLGSARLADRIVVLADGLIAEQGTHTELLARGGLYARMLGVQAKWYE